MKEPTRAEILAARETVYKRTKDEYGGMRRHKPVMECWEGVGWHTDEIYFGILIGIEIAERRKKKAKPPVSETGEARN